MPPTKLSAQEQQWILEKRLNRLTDHEEVLIYPMGAERHLASVLCGEIQESCPIRDYIVGKDILVLPGHGNSSFLFAAAGARSVTVYDQDPVTIAWIKAMKKYYHYREAGYPSVGELLGALTSWYPPLLPLPMKGLKKAVLWLLKPKALRRLYTEYLLDLLTFAIKSKVKESYEWDKPIHCHVGTVDEVASKPFDTVFTPYLLGVTNGIESVAGIVDYLKKAAQLAPKGQLLITPVQKTKEFLVTGNSYFVTTEHQDFQIIAGLVEYPHTLYPKWFRGQGLAVFSYKIGISTIT